MLTLEEVAAEIAGDCLGQHDSRLPALTADILAALRAEREGWRIATSNRAWEARQAMERHASDPAQLERFRIIADAFDDFAAAIRNQP